MKAARIFALAAAAPLAVGAAALGLGACGPDDFAAVDSGVEAGDVVTDVLGNDGGGDGDADAGPKGWCATNAPTATACADFDGVDAAAKLAPTWGVATFGNAVFVIGPSPNAPSAVDAAAPSPAQQLLANANVGDGGMPPLIVLSATGSSSPTELTLDFSFLANATSGGSGQVVEFARIDISATPLTDSLGFSLTREGTTWQIRGSVVSGQIKGMSGDPLPATAWHRVTLSLKKAGSNTYTLAVDGTPIETSTFLKAWPTTIDGTYGRIGATEVSTIDTPVKAYFDNVVWTTK